MKYECYNCGKKFEKQYQLLLHYDFHKGEPTVRPTGCVCAGTWDVRAGKCLECGRVYTQGWALDKANA